MKFHRLTTFFSGYCEEVQSVSGYGFVVWLSECPLTSGSPPFPAPSEWRDILSFIEAERIMLDQCQSWLDANLDLPSGKFIEVASTLIIVVPMLPKFRLQFNLTVEYQWLGIDKINQSRRRRTKLTWNSHRLDSEWILLVRECETAKLTFTDE